MLYRTKKIALLSTLALSVALTACGGDKKKDKDKDKDDESAEGSAEPKKKKHKKDKGDKADKGDKGDKGGGAEVALPNVETREAKPQKLGDKELKAELCKLDKSGSEMAHEWFHKALRDAALAADGSLYVLDHEIKVRKYKNQKSDGCELALDKSFGKDGVLDIGEKPDGFADKISVDKSGAVYVNTSPSKKIVDGKATDACGTLTAGAGSDVVMDNSRPLKDGKCEGEEIKFQAWGKDAYPDVLAVVPDGLFVKGTEKDGDKSVIQVGLFGMDGSKKVVVGKKDGDESICFAHGVAMLAGNVAVVDGNCRALRVWKMDGSFVGKVDLDDLTGLSIMPRVIEVGSDTAYIIGSADKKDDSKTDLGVIVRITGY